MIMSGSGPSRSGTRAAQGAAVDSLAYPHRMSQAYSVVAAASTSILTQYGNGLISRHGSAWTGKGVSELDGSRRRAAACSLLVYCGLLYRSHTLTTCRGQASWQQQPTPARGAQGKYVCAREEVGYINESSSFMVYGLQLWHAIAPTCRPE